ncbi:MAG: hypothetical protein ACI9S9_002598, partial [Planctomycetota bacterium]
KALMPNAEGSSKSITSDISTAGMSTAKPE